MDVFVIPLGRDRYELYCETSTPPVEAERPASGFVNRIRHRFTVMLRDAEQRHQAGHTAPAAATRRERLKERALAWVAERVAEQRLLWNLRGESAVLIVHPQDMTFEQADRLVRRMLQRDYERHRRWMIVDGLLFAVTFVALGPLFLLIPGVANLPALYFGFRAIGHWLSMRGASHGLRAIAWSGKACPPLDELRDVLALAPDAREARVHEIAGRLRLQHLPTFFERVAIRHA